MNGDAQWQALDSTLPDALYGACAALDRGPLGERATLFNDPRWVVALTGADKTMRAYVAQTADGLAGLATFLVHPSAVRLALGDLTLLARRVRRLNALAPPVARASERACETALMSSLLRRVRRDMERDNVVFVESVAEGTALFDLLAAASAPVEGFHVVRNGNLYRHRFADIPSDFDAYLAQLGSRTRADLRANRKRFIARVAQRYESRCFTTPTDVPRFVSDAVDVSRKTYQYRLLGAGLRAAEALESCYGETAALGWFRSYVLYADGKPVAFQVGHVYRKTFHAQEIGYDPDWASSHVGIFLHTEIVADLAASGGAVAAFDFGNGDNLHKQRLSTTSRLEGYFYLIPDDARGTLIARSMQAGNNVSSAIGGVLERLGVRKQTKAVLRRLGVMK